MRANKIAILIAAAGFIAGLNVLPAAQAQTSKKPNILVIWGDDIGWFNPSCYNNGIMGYKTPNMDCIAREGAMFTDWYGRKAAPPGDLHSSPARLASAPATSRSAYPEPQKA